MLEDRNAAQTATVALTSEQLITVSATDLTTGCAATDSILISVDDKLPEEINVRNGITPNGDGNNDVWYIEGIESYPNNEVIIYNRWGDELVRFNGYDNTTIFWDGRNREGKLVPDGTYYYLLKIRGKEAKTGWVQVRARLY